MTAEWRQDDVLGRGGVGSSVSKICVQGWPLLRAGGEEGVCTGAGVCRFGGGPWGRCVPWPLPGETRSGHWWSAGMGRAWGASQGDFWACSVNAGSWCVVTLPKAGFVVTCFPTPAAFAYQARVLESVVSRGGRRPCLHWGLGASSRGKRRTGPRRGGAPGKVQESSAPEFRGGGGSRRAREPVSWWVEAGAGPLEERTLMLAMPGHG